MKLLYAGSFDPLHLGHCDIIDRARMMGELTVLVASHETKKPLLNSHQRMTLIEDLYLQAEVKIALLPHGTFTGHFAKANKIDYLVRGTRGRDIEEEMALASFNKEQFGIETILLPCDDRYQRCSSSMIKAAMRNDGWHRIVQEYVPGNVFNLLKGRGFTS